MDRQLLILQSLFKRYLGKNVTFDNKPIVADKEQFKTFTNLLSDIKEKEAAPEQDIEKIQSLILDAMSSAQEMGIEMEHHSLLDNS